MRAVEWQTKRVRDEKEKETVRRTGQQLSTADRIARSAAVQSAAVPSSSTFSSSSSSSSSGAHTAKRESMRHCGGGRSGGRSGGGGSRSTGSGTHSVRHTTLQAAPAVQQKDS